jgi:hypothetical protein
MRNVCVVGIIEPMWLAMTNTLSFVVVVLKILLVTVSKGRLPNEATQP